MPATPPSAPPAHAPLPPALWAQLREGVVVLDAAGRILSANAAAGALFGLSPEQLAGRSFQDLVVDAAAPALFTQAGDTAIALTGRHADGGSFPLEVLACTQESEGRRLQTLVVRDAARQQEEAWRIRAAGERRHKTFQLASHELRTPLASIVGFSELLLKREFDADTARELLQIVHDQAGLMATMVNGVLDLARIEAGGRQALRIASEPIDGILVQAIASLAAQDGSARIVLDIAPGLPCVAADAHRLSQALAGILRNSLLYGAPGTPVTVGVGLAPGGAALLLRIADQGEGMTNEERERLFEAFYRGARAAATPGTGLGLAIVKEIIDLHHGSIEVASTPGAGSTVTLRLPAARGAPDA